MAGKGFLFQPLAHYSHVETETGIFLNAKGNYVEEARLATASSPSL
jgi:hypothetical protein